MGVGPATRARPWPSPGSSGPSSIHSADPVDGELLDTDLVQDSGLLTRRSRGVPVVAVRLQLPVLGLLHVRLGSRHLRHLGLLSHQSFTSNPTCASFGVTALRHFTMGCPRASPEEEPTHRHHVRGLALPPEPTRHRVRVLGDEDRKSTRLNSSHVEISYAVFCLN